MGNNQAYSSFQSTVIRLYNRGKLDLELLDELAEEWRDTDIDSGGDTGLLAHDGSDLSAICIRLVDPGWTVPQPTTPEERATYEQDGEQWKWSAHYWKWVEITRGRWGWR